jgi:hypothetical protein
VLRRPLENTRLTRYLAESAVYYTNMARYTVPHSKSNKKAIRTYAYGSIALMLVVLPISQAASGVAGGRANQTQAADLKRMVAMPNCKRNPQLEQMTCTTVLPRLIDTKRSRAGDHLLLPANLITSSPEEPITTLVATIVEVQSKAKGRSVLRIRVDKALRKDGHEFPLEATVVALASPSIVIERSDFPSIIDDRFPRIPEDDERQPGERKLSEDPSRISPIDSRPEVPVQRKVICSKKVNRLTGNPCVDLMEARGIYGLKAVTLEPADPSSPAESVLHSKKDIRLVSGTVLVLQMKSIPPIF